MLNQHIALTHINRMANPMTGGPTFGFTAEYGRRWASTWEDKNIGDQGGQIVRIGERVKELVVAQDLGFLFQNAVAASETATIVPYEAPFAA